MASLVLGIGGWRRRWNFGFLANQDKLLELFLTAPLAFADAVAEPTKGKMEEGSGEPLDHLRAFKPERAWW